MLTAKCTQSLLFNIWLSVECTYANRVFSLHDIFKQCILSFNSVLYIARLSKVVFETFLDRVVFGKRQYFFSCRFDIGCSIYSTVADSKATIAAVVVLVRPWWWSPKISCYMLSSADVSHCYWYMYLILLSLWRIQISPRPWRYLPFGVDLLFIYFVIQNNEQSSRKGEKCCKGFRWKNSWEKLQNYMSRT